MRNSFATLTGMLLFCGAAALSISRPKPKKKKAESKSANADEDIVMLGGVPVYDLHRGLAYARKTDSFAKGAGTEEKDAVVHFIVQLKGDITEERLDTLCDDVFKNCADHGDMTNATGHTGIPFLVSHCTVAELQESLAKAKSDVVSASHDLPTHMLDGHLDFSGILADDREAAATWGLNRINKDSAPAAGFGVHAYVLDTGVRTTHSQFEGRAIPQLEALGTTRKCECQNTTCASDTRGHGTHCAGTIAGVDFGVAPQARIHAVKVLGDDGRGSTSWSMSALSWIRVNGMRPAVVSMSLGGAGKNFYMRFSIEAVVEDGIPVVVAAGNDQDDACEYSPAYVPDAVTVGSTTSLDGLSSFSNYGTCVDILAPGSGIQSAGVDSDTATSYKSGTSMACPHVSGAVAILFALNPAMTPAQILTELLAEAETGAISGLPGGTVNSLLQVDSLSGR